MMDDGWKNIGCLWAAAAAWMPGTPRAHVRTRAYELRPAGKERTKGRASEGVDDAPDGS